LSLDFIVKKKIEINNFNVVFLILALTHLFKFKIKTDISEEINELKMYFQIL